MAKGNAPKFAAGDLVELRSGGPVMTIERVVTDYQGIFEGLYACSWFAGAKDNHRNFREEALKAAEVD